MPNQVSEGEITLAIGTTGSGKSHDLRRQLSQRAPNRMLVWDVSGDYAKDPAIPGRRWTNLASLFESLRKSELGREIVPARRAEFQALLRYAFASAHMLLVLEELGAYTSAKDFPAEELDNIAFRSRDRGLDVVAVTQRPQVALPVNLYTQAKRLWLYRLDSLADQRWCERELKLSPEESARLGTLERGAKISKYRGFLPNAERKP